MLGDSGITCFCIYEVETTLVSGSNTRSHGQQIPGVIEYSETSVQLSLLVDSNLVANEQYSAIITAISTNGEAESSGTIEFSKLLYILLFSLSEMDSVVFMYRYL